jgi:hypothetical protein
VALIIGARSQRYPEPTDILARAIFSKADIYESRVGLEMDMQKLWEDLVTYTRMLVLAIVIIQYIAY